LPRALLEEIPDLLCRWRPDGTLVYVNDNYCRYFGKTRDELVGRSFKPLIAQEDRDRVARVLQGLCRDKPVDSVEHRVVLADGSIRWQEWTNRCLFDAAGEIIGYQATGRDITRRKRAEAVKLAELDRARAQHEVLSTITASHTLIDGDVESLVCLVTELGARATCTERASVWLFNEDESKLRCIDLYEATPGRHSAGMMLRESEFRDEFRALKEARYIDADDALIDPRVAGYVETYLKPHRITSMLDTVIEVSGRHIGVLCLEHVDRPHCWHADEIAFACQLADKIALCISHRDRRCVQEELEEAQRLSHLGNWYLRLPDTLTCSAEVLRIFGLEAPGPSPAVEQFMRLMAPESATPLAAALARCSKTGQPYELDLELRRPAGEVRRVVARGEPVHAASGAIVALRGTIQDVTERVDMEARLARAQRLESIGQLTGGVAHDFNNILTVVLANAELLCESLADDDRLRGLAELISRGASRGAELTHQLLAFARRQPLDPQSVDPSVLLEDMRGLLSRSLTEQIELSIRCDGSIWPVMVDAAQLESAVLNLAINSRDAMPQGGRLSIEAGNIVIGEEDIARYGELAPGDYIRVSVSDTGCGIPPEILPRVLEPFFTTKEKGKGTGLGLSMAFGFASQSGGLLVIESRPGEGTAVHLYLPRSGEPARPAVAQGAGGYEPSVGQTTVLLVEDDEMVRHCAGTQLDALGYRVICAANGPEGLEIVRKRDDIELLFTDMVMPGGMSGRDLAEAALAIRPQLKVLFTSGHTDDITVNRGGLQPGSRLLRKPYRPSELARTLRKVMAEA
jgi:PAS domain S-box-containing protein